MKGMLRREERGVTRSEKGKKDEDAREERSEKMRIKRGRRETGVRI